MKQILFALSFIATVVFISCGDGNVKINPDPEVQAAEDSAIIVNYFADLGYEGDEVKATTSGVRYVMVSEGTGKVIEESNIVTFDFTGKLTNDTIFDTTIEEVADSIRTKIAADTAGKENIETQLLFLSRFPEGANYSPVTLTYSSTGWTLGEFINGFRDGVAASFNKAKVGSSILIAIPSAEGYGSDFRRPPTIPENAVLIFELYPIEAVEQ
ncbi:MAG: hypothetical protein Tsb0034_05870 [Ekhidna sp.]